MKTHKWIPLAPRRSRTVPVGKPTGALRVNLLGQMAPIILVPGILLASVHAAPAATCGHHARAHHTSSRACNGVSDDSGIVRIPWMY
jgi:hypothetical protein